MNWWVKTVFFLYPQVSFLKEALPHLEDSLDKKCLEEIVSGLVCVTPQTPNNQNLLGQTLTPTSNTPPGTPTTSKKHKGKKDATGTPTTSKKHKGKKDATYGVPYLLQIFSHSDYPQTLIYLFIFGKTHCLKVHFNPHVYSICSLQSVWIAMSASFLKTKLPPPR